MKKILTITLSVCILFLTCSCVGRYDPKSIVSNSYFKEYNLTNEYQKKFGKIVDSFVDKSFVYLSKNKKKKLWSDNWFINDEIPWLDDIENIYYFDKEQEDLVCVTLSEDIDALGYENNTSFSCVFSVDKRSMKATPIIGFHTKNGQIDGEFKVDSNYAIDYFCYMLTFMTSDVEYLKKNVYNEETTKKRKEDNMEYAIDKYIGKTVQDITKEYGTNYDVTRMNGYLALYYDDCPYVFYFTEYLGIKESVIADQNGVKPHSSDIVRGFYVDNSSKNNGVEVFRGIKIGDSREKVEQLYDIQYDTGIVGGKTYVDGYTIDWTFMLGSNHAEASDDKLILVDVYKQIDTNVTAKHEEYNDAYQDDSSLIVGEKFEISGIVQYSNEPCDIGMEYCYITGDKYYDYYYDTTGNYVECVQASPEKTFYATGKDLETLKKYIGQKVTVSGQFYADCHGIPYITKISILTFN